MHGIVPSYPQPSPATRRKPLRQPERNFARIARTLWPRKTAAELASRCDVTQRTAENWLAGHEPSARALAVIIAEMLG